MQRFSSFRAACWVVAFVASVVTGSAGAQAPTDDELARNYFQLGTAQLDRGDYEAAVGSFEQAYRLSGRPALLFNLYVAYERLGDLERAVSHLSQYLASGEEVENRAALEVRLENLQRRLAARRAGEPDPVPEAEPTGEPGAGDAANPTTDGPSSPSAEVETRTPPRLAPILLWSSAGAVAIGATVAAVMARAEDQRLEDECHTAAGVICSSSEVQGLRRRNITADVGFGLTLGLATAALVVQLVGDDDDEAAVAVAPFVERHAAGLVVGGRF